MVAVMHLQLEGADGIVNNKEIDRLADDVIRDGE